MTRSRVPTLDGYDEAKSPGFYPIDISKKLERDSQSYFQLLQSKVCDDTFYSHQQAIRNFVDWSQRDSHWYRNLDDMVTAYVEYLHTRDDYSTGTAVGYVPPLTNFIAFITQKDPEVISILLKSSISKTDIADNTALGDEISQYTSTVSPSGIPESAICNFVSYLENSCFGTRVHIFVKLLLETYAGPKFIRKLDIEDIEFDSQQVSIGTPATHLVSKYDLVKRVEFPLSETTIDALSEYCDRDRSSDSNDNSAPLLTTYDGRVSSTTLRREVKSKSDVISVTSDQSSQHPKFNTETASGDHSKKIPILPRDIRWYTISNLVE
jgi:hypothetical protein